MTETKEKPLSRQAKHAAKEKRKGYRYRGLKVHDNHYDRLKAYADYLLTLDPDEEI